MMEKVKFEKLNHEIGAFVQATRKANGWKQTEIAKRLGLDQSALSRVENGKQSLTAAQWVTFCEGLSVVFRAGEWS